MLSPSHWLVLVQSLQLQQQWPVVELTISWINVVVFSDNLTDKAYPEEPLSRNCSLIKWSCVFRYEQHTLLYSFIGLTAATQQFIPGLIADINEAQAGDNLVTCENVSHVKLWQSPAKHSRQTANTAWLETLCCPAELNTVNLEYTEWCHVAYTTNIRQVSLQTRRDDGFYVSTLTWLSVPAPHPPPDSR